MDEEYVFCLFEDARCGDHLDLNPVMAITEPEGLTIVIPRYIAIKISVKFEFTFRRITLRIHSGLDAIGLKATFSNKLVERGISAYALAGYYHDIIYVQSEFAEPAMASPGELTH